MLRKKGEFVSAAETESSEVLNAMTLQYRLQRLYDDYSACLDAGEFDRWPDFFTDDCRYRVQSAENAEAGLPHAAIYCDGKGMLRDRVSATRVMVYERRRQRRFISGLKVIGEEAGVIRSTAIVLLTEAMIDRDPVLAMTGYFADEIVTIGEQLRFRDRLCVYDNYRIVQNLMFPV